VEERSLSMAWARAFLAVYEQGEISCLTTSATGFRRGEPVEDASVRAVLEEELLRAGKPSCGAVANTIFPRSLWNPDAAAQDLFERYGRIRARILRRNPRGTYFDRMTSYGPCELNQLDYIIKTWKAGNHRRSALQVLTLEPSRDDTNQRRRGFPCLSQVSFTPARGTLSVTGYYPIQYMFARAYGNYLGLARLGVFMARELALELVRVNCVANVAHRDCSIGEAGHLVSRLRSILETMGDAP
jgi:hypothetical protein